MTDVGRMSVGELVLEVGHQRLAISGDEAPKRRHPLAELVAERSHVGHRQQRMAGAEQLLQELLGVAKVARADPLLKRPYIPGDNLYASWPSPKPRRSHGTTQTATRGAAVPPRSAPARAGLTLGGLGRDRRVVRAVDGDQVAGPLNWSSSTW